jgi:hypothetical protein
VDAVAAHFELEDLRHLLSIEAGGVPNPLPLDLIKNDMLRWYEAHPVCTNPDPHQPHQSTLLSGHSASGHAVHLVPLTDKTSAEWRSVVTPFESHWRGPANNVAVHRVAVTAVYRVQNPDLVARYAEKLVAVADARGLPYHAAESTGLYHTPNNETHSFYADGLDVQFSRGGNMGKAVYGTASPSKADCYFSLPLTSVPKLSLGERYTLQIRMVTGVPEHLPYACVSKQRDIKASAGTDSARGAFSSPTDVEVAVYDSSQVHIEYAIVYKVMLHVDASFYTPSASRLMMMMPLRHKPKYTRAPRKNKNAATATSVSKRSKAKGSN